MTPRRWALLKRLDSVPPLRNVWRACQEAEAGTALAAGFPYLSRLQAAGYSCREDLVGADASELRAQGFDMREAEQIVAAAEGF